MDDHLSKFFTQDELGLARRLFNPFYDKLYLSDKVSYIDAVLLSIYMACNLTGSSTIKYNDAKEIYLKFGRKENYFKIYLHRAVYSEFVERKGNDLTLTSKGIARVKEILGSEFGIRTYLIKSGEMFSGRIKVEDLIFKHLSGIVYICDPYCDIDTLHFLSRISEEAHLLLLTGQIKDLKGKFISYLNAFMKEYPHIKIEIKIHKEKKLHDRFIIFKNNKIAYSLGTSLNGIGKRDCLIIKLPEEIYEALVELFERRWNEAYSLNEILREED